MSGFIEKVLHLIYPIGNWGSETGYKADIVEWGRLWVHVALGFLVSSPSIIFVGLFGWIGMIWFIVPFVFPFIREFIIDGHKFSILLEDSKVKIDVVSDILSCLVGPVLTIFNAIILQLIRSF